MLRSSAWTSVVVAAALSLTGCAYQASATIVNPAAQLRDQDLSAHGTAHAQASYTKAFKALTADCKEQGTALASTVDAVLAALQKAKFDDETRLTLMQHLAATTTVPAGTPKTSCATLGTAYIALRKSQ
ncbi:hypothetical protein ABUW04_11055 [Streptacidiphilus sp. N1-10]|uniref:Lipoprotein n=1 Tax=Streptacidiphilus jeojiensis TaxID=3229225 RepID=A0ABV6XKS3_9ACTN